MGVSLNGGTPNSHPKCWSFLVGRPMVVGETHHFRKPHIINCLDSRVSLLTWKFLPVFLGEAFIGIFGWLGCSLPTGPWHERCFSRFLGHPFVFLSWEGFVNLHFPLGRGTFQWVDVYFMDQGAAYSSRAQVSSFWHGPKTPGQESSSIGTEHSGLFGRQNQYLSIALWWVFHGFCICVFLVNGRWMLSCQIPQPPLRSIHVNGPSVTSLLFQKWYLRSTFLLERW